MSEPTKLKKCDNIKVQTPFPKMHAQIKEENVTQPKALSIILIIYI
jgi:hypothetical protein